MSQEAKLQQGPRNPIATELSKRLASGKPAFTQFSFSLTCRTSVRGRTNRRRQSKE